MKKRILPALFCLIQTLAPAQFSLNGQLIQRSEFRNGYNKIIDESLDPAVFVAQRFRLAGNYHANNLKLYCALQDIRTWGSAAHSKTTDNLFSLYEGWVQININSFWKIKLGRQELKYDNARLFGNADWALQGRSHDFALIQFEKHQHQLHVGAGYNQDAQALTGAVYTVPNHYQNAQLVRYQMGKKDFTISVLGWNNGLQYVEYDSTGKVKMKSIRYTQTFGISGIKYKIKSTSFSCFGYYQTGNDVKNREMNAYDAGLQISHALLFNDSTMHGLNISMGGEVLSGTANNSSVNENRSFSPFYGTNHGFNGFMDMYYINGRHENSVGLIDIYVMFRYNFNRNIFMAIDGHMFSAQANVSDNAGSKLSKDLGQEADFTFGYVFNKSFSLQGGYSQYFSTSTLNYLHKVANPKPIQNWAYLMLIIKVNGADKSDLVSK